MTHLNADELLDALEGLLAPERQAHLASCEACRQQLEDLQSVLHEARQVSVPEPSPLFWEHLSRRVRTAIDVEPLPAGGFTAWLRWPVLAPVAALALVVLALLVAMPIREESPGTALEVADQDPLLSDENWVMVADLVGDVDWDMARAAGVSPEPGVVDQAVLELTPEEQQELTRLLRAELMRAKS
jgi:hypothetical protein